MAHRKAELRGVSEGTLPCAGMAAVGSCVEVVVASDLVMRPSSQA